MIKHLIKIILLFITISIVFAAPKQQKITLFNGFDVYGDAIKQVLNNYIDSVDIELLINNSINGMLDSLDEYSEYYEGVEDNEMHILTDGKYFGYGVEIKEIDEEVTFIKIRDNSPARRSGIRTGDIIIAINNKVLENNKLQIVENIFQYADTISLLIKREKVDTLINFYINKDTISVQSIPFSKILDNQYGYIKIEQFSVTTSNEFLKHYYYLIKQKTLKGLIIDLRWNGGGILQEALKILNLFIPKETLLLKTIGRNLKQEYYTRTIPIDTLLPLMVLINNESASASEIVAGVLQDLDRAIIVGSNSYGKGLVQEIFPLPNNRMLKLTTAKYYTPSGRCIQKKTLPELYKNQQVSKFYTQKGKPVYEQNGITPDFILISDTLLSGLSQEIVNEFMVFNFVNNYLLYNPHITDDSIAIYTKFVNFITENYSNRFSKIKAIDLLLETENNENIKQILTQTITNITNEIKKILLTDIICKNELYKQIDINIKYQQLSEQDFIKYYNNKDNFIEQSVKIFNQLIIE